MTSSDERASGRSAWSKWIRRLALGTLGLLAAGTVAGLIWWQFRGARFLYGVIQPDNARLLAGHEVPEQTTAEALREDLRFLAGELPRRHVAFDQAFDREELESRIAELDARAADLSPLRRQLELLGLLAMGGVGTGHTMVVPFQQALGWRYLPVATFWFDDGLFVTAAASRYEAAVGSKIERIGPAPVGEALATLLRYVPGDNELSRKANLPLLLTFAEPFAALGYATADGSVTLGLAGGAEIAVEPVEIASLAGLAWGRRSFAPADTGWSPADPRPRARHYALDYRGDSRTLYLALHALRNQDDETIAELARRLDETARAQPVERFVLDLRHNGGGNNELGRPLVETISDHPVLDREGLLFVLIGRRTFSAAANFACALERRTKAIFVGEESGFAPSHFGDPVSVLLPGSKIVVRLASRFWQEELPAVRRESLVPQLFTPLRSTDHFADHDPAMEAVLAYEPAPARAPADLPPESLGAYLLSPHHRVRVWVGEEGRPRLAIETVGTFAITDLYRGEGGTWTTDTDDVHLHPGDEAANPTLWWKGTSYSLARVEDDVRLPIELVQAGEIAAGVAAFDAAHESAVDLGSGLELALNRLGYEELGKGRTREAIRLFELGTRLFPGVANSWDSLGDGLRARGDREGAIAAYRHALSLDALYRNSLRQLEALASPR